MWPDQGTSQQLSARSKDQWLYLKRLPIRSWCQHTPGWKGRHSTISEINFLPLQQNGNSMSDWSWFKWSQEVCYFLHFRFDRLRFTTPTIVTRTLEVLGVRNVRIQQEWNQEVWGKPGRISNLGISEKRKALKSEISKGRYAEEEN